MEKSAVDEIGQGRVWTGENALKNGLIDMYGGLNESIELAAEIARQSGKPVAYTNLSQEAYAAALVETGMPPAVAAMLADADAGVAQDALFDASGQLGRLIGRPTTPISETVRGVLAGAR